MAFDWWVTTFIYRIFKQFANHQLSFLFQVRLKIQQSFFPFYRNVKGGRDSFIHIGLGYPMTRPKLTHNTKKKKVQEQSSLSFPKIEYLLIYFQLSPNARHSKIINKQSDHSILKQCRDFWTIFPAKII